MFALLFLRLLLLNAGRVWTGSEMIVWGGNEFPTGATNTGGRYNPSMDN